MCVIIACPPGTDPGVDVLCDAMWDNEDGSGFAIRHNGTITVVRSHDDMQYVLNEWQRLRAQHPTAWAVWHSRLATHGSVNADNVHPFNVPGRPWVLAHNGILPLNDGPLPDRDRSDSRILAEDHVSRMTWGTIKAQRVDFERWLGSDRVVIMSERREKGGPVIILNESQGYWGADGCWYSAGIYGGGCKKCGHGWKRCVCPYVKSTHGADDGWTTWNDELDGTVTGNAHAGDAAWDDISEDDAWEEYLTVRYGAGIHGLTDAEYDELEALELAETHEEANILDAILCEKDA